MVVACQRRALLAALVLLSLPGGARLAAAASASDAAELADLPLQVQLINQQVRTAWEDQGLTASKPASDGEWCRRIYLDLVGRVPTVDELLAFTESRSPTKKSELVDRLLGDEYLEEYARHLTTVWTNLLIGRTGGANRNSLADRSGMQQYLRRSFQRNKPMDLMMRELVTASGSCRPGDEDFNGAANFLADKMAEDGVQATAVTARVFLGTAVQCTQCHNHPFNEYRQNQFWEMNAFFRQTRVQRLDTEQNNRRVARVLDRDFAGEGGDPTKAEVYYELRNGKLKVAYPVFIDGTSLAKLYEDQGEDYGDSGYVSEINRREELAQLIRQSPEFPRAIVNRVWGQLLGYGFTKPIDDMGPHNSPSHPDLMEQLAKEFRESSFDMKELTRWIVLSTPYSLSSEAERGNAGDDPALGVKPMFSHFYLRQMTAEQLYESLLVATQADESLGFAERERVKQRWLAQFNTAFGNDENGESTTFNGSIPQVLMMMNGDLIKRATSADDGSFLYRVASDGDLSGAEKVKQLYLAALSRPPGRDELKLCNKLLAAQMQNQRDGASDRGRRAGNGRPRPRRDAPMGRRPSADAAMAMALQDIWWALLNSNEFILNH